MNPNKVTIEITPEHYTISVYRDDKLLAARKSIMDGAGSAKAEVPGDWYDHEDEITPELAEALDQELSFGPFEVAGTLCKLNG